MVLSLRSSPRVVCVRGPLEALLRKLASIKFITMLCHVWVFIVDEDVDWWGMPKGILFRSLYRGRAALSAYTRRGSATSNYMCIAIHETVFHLIRNFGPQNGPTIQRISTSYIGESPSPAQVHMAVRQIPCNGDFIAGDWRSYLIRDVDDGRLNANIGDVGAHHDCLLTPEGVARGKEMVGGRVLLWYPVLYVQCQW